MLKEMTKLSWRTAGTPLKTNIFCMLLYVLLVYPRVYPKPVVPAGYPYPSVRVWVIAGKGTGMSSDTQGYTRAIH
jgi:hypothetical protein